MLFVRDRDPARETWDGARAGPEGATRDYGADDAFPITDIDEILPGLIENRTRVFYTMGDAPGIRPARGRLGERPAHPGAQRHAIRRRSSSRWITCCTTCACSRAARELDVDARARRASPRGAHVRAMRFCRPGRMRVRGRWRRSCTSSAATTPTPPTSPSSAAAPTPASCTTARTTAAARRRSAADRCGLRVRLLRLGHHAHLSGQRPLHAEQRAVYDIVLEAQRAAIAKVAPGQSLERAARGGRAA